MRILAVKLSSLGDLFHSLPAVHNLKVGLDARVDWLTQSDYAELVACFSDVDRVLRFPRRGFPSGLGRFVGELRAAAYDYVIDFQGLLKSAVLTRAARGRQRIGPSFHREGSRLFYSSVAGKPNRDRHAVEQNLDVVRFLGLERIDPVFPVDFPQVALAAGRPRVAVVPVSRWPTKNWPPACFAQVARRLQRVRGASVFLLGGARDAGVCEQIRRELEGDAENLAGRCSLVQSGGVLREMDLLIANDSGPVHMAAAVHTPALVLFGPTDPSRTGPYGEGHRVLTAPVPCRPCFSRVCRRPGIPCLTQITPERAGDMALEMLANRADSQKS